MMGSRLQRCHPGRSQKVAGRGGPSATHPGSWQSRLGPPLWRRGMLRARGSPALPGHPPAARDGQANDAKRSPGRKAGTKPAAQRPGEGSWAGAQLGRALPATFHACLLLVFPPARGTQPQNQFLLV